jgi:hypothetical protein
MIGSEGLPLCRCCYQRMAPDGSEGLPLCCYCYRRTAAQETGLLLDFNHVMERLAKKRPIFHSEADFQHALAWEIHNVRPEATIRLELPVRADDGRAVHIDLLVVIENQRFAIELKYKTASLDVRRGSEQFSLRGQSAQDCGRYDFLSDVVRLERYVASEKPAMGFALLLSNDWLYWKKTRPNNIAVNFSIHEGREIASNASMAWARDGYTKGREAPITCQSRYSCSWRDYSTIEERGSTMPNGRFRYLLLPVRHAREEAFSHHTGLGS